MVTKPKVRIRPGTPRIVSSHPIRRSGPTGPALGTAIMPGPLYGRRPHVPVPGKLIFQVMSGSRAYGLARAGSDEDWRGVYQASTESLLGLHAPKEHVEFPPDQQYWELTHFARMCLNGNPNVMELLWIPSDMIALDSNPARALRAMRRGFLTIDTATAYFGWIKSTRLKMAPTTVRVGGGNRAALPTDRQDDLLEGKRGSHLVRIATNFLELVGVVVHVPPVRWKSASRGAI